MGFLIGSSQGKELRLIGTLNPTSDWGTALPAERPGCRIQGDRRDVGGREDREVHALHVR